MKEKTKVEEIILYMWIIIPSNDIIIIIIQFHER